MPITTAECEGRLSEALDFYYANDSSNPVRKVAAKYEVSHHTLSNLITGKHCSVLSNGGLNKLLAVA
jgi:hypothetical protein